MALFSRLHSISMSHSKRWWHEDSGEMELYFVYMGTQNKWELLPWNCTEDLHPGSQERIFRDKERACILVGKSGKWVSVAQLLVLIWYLRECWSWVTHFNCQYNLGKEIGKGSSRGCVQEAWLALVLVLSRGGEWDWACCVSDGMLKIRW